MKYSIVDKTSGEVIFSGLCVGGSFGDSPALTSASVHGIPQHVLDNIEEYMGDKEYELDVVEEEDI